MSATEPPPVEPTKDAHVPTPAPDSTDDDEKTPVSPPEKRKMKNALDAFLTRD